MHFRELLLPIFRFFVTIALAVPALAAPPRCASGTLACSLELKVKGPSGAEPRSIRDVNVIQPGARLLYTPKQIPVEKPAKARISLVLAPADFNQPIEVTDPKRADRPNEWRVASRLGVIGVVFGPQGLDRKKVRHLVGEDMDLMMQLAEYAEKSTQAENLLQALAAYDRQPRSRQNLEAALSGFAGAWRLPMSRLDGSAPLDQQAGLLLRTLNPALASIDPLAPQGTTKLQQTAGLAASVAGLFWGNTVGIAAGSTALFLNLRTMLFPNSDFRSTFAQPAAEQLALCTSREPKKPRTRLAYLWAVKIPNLDPPHLALARAAHLGTGLRSEVELSKTEMEGRFLLRARDWRLVRAGASENFPVRVLPANASGALTALQLDLTNAEVPPGEYRLHGRWDWTDFLVDGAIHVHEIGPLESARLTPESEDRLVAGNGRVMLELTGADFQFVQKVTLRQPNDPGSRTADLELLSAKHGGSGPAPSLQTLVDVSKLPAGRYALRIEQSGKQVTEIPVSILPPHPSLDGLPLRVNLGEKEQVVSLHGRGLERLEAASADGASLDLLKGDSTARRLRVRLSGHVREGELIALHLKVEGLHKELIAKDALIVAGPRPRILALAASSPPESSVEIRPGELVAGVSRTFSVRTWGLDNTARARVACEDSALTLSAISLRSGEEQRGVMLQVTDPNTLFLSLEPGTIGPPGCRLMLTVETEKQGISDAKPLGTVVRLPQIEKFDFTEERTEDGLYVATLEGYELDTIAKTGWNWAEGFQVLGLPAPVPGAGHRQVLRIALPWPAPSPHAPLYVFLHKEILGRLTKTHL
jgi:hypothetical protein